MIQRLAKPDPPHTAVASRRLARALCCTLAGWWLVTMGSSIAQGAMGLARAASASTAPVSSAATPASPPPAQGVDARAGSYGCPMHPDVRSSAPGTCSRCGMDLVPMGPPGGPPYRVHLETLPKSVKAGEPVELRFAITHPTTGETVKTFEIVHDMPFHLFVVSEDLEFYDHIHPTQQPDGGFVVDTVLPTDGSYILFCDFFPSGGTPQIVRQSLVTAGYRPPAPLVRAPIVPDAVLTKSVGGIRFELTLEPPRPASGHAAALMYHLVDEKNGEPIRDLEPYLGAWGHTLVLSEDTADYLHSHPTQLIPAGADRATLHSGPDVAFNVLFRDPGIYRLWSQFQRQGKVTTVSFTIRVAAVEHLVVWDGSQWMPLRGAAPSTLNGPVRALAASGGDLYAGGDFTLAGDVKTTHVARWDGTRWSGLGDGVDGPVWAIAVRGKDVYVGGEFAAAGGAPAGRIARWDGRSWSALGEGIGGTKDPSRPPVVYSLALYGSDLVAGGRFTTAGGATAEGIARWDGRGWSAVGGGVASGSYDGVVWALATAGDSLYAGGQFLTAGGLAVHGVARWEGRVWSALGGGVTGGLERVSALAVRGRDLFVGGDFASAGDTRANKFARWDGEHWHSLEVQTTEEVRTITAAGSVVYIGGGSFATPGGPRTNGIIKWDGSRWSPLGGGVGSGAFLAPVLGIASSGGRLYVGGGPFVVGSGPP